MRVYSQVPAKNQSVLNLDINLDDAFSGFSVAAGTGNVVHLIGVGCDIEELCGYLCARPELHVPGCERATEVAAEAEEEAL